VGNDISIDRLKAGDESAFKEVITMYQKRVLKIAYGYTHDLNDSADISQEVFITLFKNLKKITSHEHLKLLIYRITVSRSLDFLRREKYRKFFKPFSEMSENRVNNFTTGEITQEQNIKSSEFDAALGDALKKLSSNQKTAFMLKNHEGLSIREIAEVTGKSESTVKTHLGRAVKTIRKHMEKNYER